MLGRGTRACAGRDRSGEAVYTPRAHGTGKEVEDCCRRPRNQPLLPHRRERNPRSFAASRAPAAKQTVFDRVAAATEELASGLTEAASATKELGRSMEQIAAGAEEAAGASQEQSAAIKRIVASFGAARTEAEKSGRRSEALIGTLAEATTQIVASVRSIERNAERQMASVAVITELERRAKDIGEITQTVSRISDQTNLLALNAAIEAARAGEHGRGFAVVADEVRTLAETSDKNAREVQELASSIGGDVQRIVDALKKAAETAAKETKVGRERRERAASPARRHGEARGGQPGDSDGRRGGGACRGRGRKGAEQIASAAEEQSSGAAEAQTAVQQQAKSLDQAQMAAQGARRARRGPAPRERRRLLRRTDRRDRGGALGHHPGIVERRESGHGRGRADRSRLPAPGVRDARDVGRARADRKECAARRNKCPRVRRARSNPRCGAEERPRLGRTPGRRRDRGPRRHAVERLHREPARRRRPQDREDRRCDRVDRSADQHAGRERFGRSSTRRRFGTRVCGRLERHPHSLARGVRRMSSARRTRCAAFSIRSQS